MTSGNGQVLSVPPGFRFHPTEEELLYYYLRKKVSYQSIDLQVIREVDLNKIEPWDLKDKCRIGTCPQNDFYFFSHKDKKYPTGTRTNRATTVGFWKATGRDKSIHLTDSKRIGMRKTLVFYTGRAPHGHKTDWIMHEYRLDDQTTIEIQENGWVVCRVFMKKNHYNRGSHQDHVLMEELEEEDHDHQYRLNNNVHDHFQTQSEHYQRPINTHSFLQYPTNYNNPNVDQTTTSHRLKLATDFPINNPSSNLVIGSTQLQVLPQLLTHDQPSPCVIRGHSNSFINSTSLNVDQKVVKLTSTAVGSSGSGDWCFLEKLLANNHPNQKQLLQPSSSHELTDLNNNDNNKLPLHYLGCEAEMFTMKYPK